MDGVRGGMILPLSSPPAGFFFKKNPLPPPVQIHRQRPAPHPGDSHLVAPALRRQRPAPPQIRELKGCV